jgi:purine-binding chemotaxis protein CheW
MNDDRQFSTFVVDGYLFGVPVIHVQEVIRYQEMTQVPLSPGTVGGLINLRGQIVMAIDLRRRLDFGPRPEGELPMNVVIKTDDGAVSLLVDRIGDVIEIDDERFEVPPDTLQGVARDLIDGVYKLDDGLLLSLDVERATLATAGVRD